MSRLGARLYSSLVITTGLSIAGLAGLLLVLTLYSLIGPFRFCAAPNAPLAAAIRDARVELLHPPRAWRIGVRADALGPTRLLVRITNATGEDARDVEVRVAWAAPARQARLLPTKIGQRPAELRFEPGGSEARLLLAELRDGESLAYTLDLE